MPKLPWLGADVGRGCKADGRQEVAPDDLDSANGRSAGFDCSGHGASGSEKRLIADAQFKNALLVGLTSIVLR